MKRKLTVCIRNITPAQISSIEKVAAEKGWTVEFYEKDEDGIKAAKDSEVVFADSPKFALDAPYLKWICCPSAGINHFTSSEEFVRSGIMLSNSSGAYGVTISEHIIMSALVMLRRIPEYQKVVASKKWKRDYVIESIKGSSVTFLGTGDIGKETAVRVRAFDPRKMTGVNTTGIDDSGLFDEMRSSEELKDVLPGTDILIMSLPNTEKTRCIMDEEKLSLLPHGALIVNVGRGTCIDEEALIRMLKEGRLRAALDVFCKEPIPEDSELWDCPNLMITPHVAGDMYLPYTVQRIVDMFLEDFSRYTEGEMPVKLVDLARGY